MQKAVHALSSFSHICLQEQVQQHPLSADLSKVQRLVQPVPESNEFWDFLKGSVLVRLDDVLWGLQGGRKSNSHCNILSYRTTQKWSTKRTNSHLSGWSGKTWGRSYRTGRLQQTDPTTQHSVSTETCEETKQLTSNPLLQTENCHQTHFNSIRERCPPSILLTTYRYPLLF